MKKYFIILIVFTVFQGFSQQDSQYSLYQFNQFAINPAYAGSRDAIAVVADIRKQWGGVGGAPTTGVVSVHSPLKNKKLGVGLNVLSDKIGPKSVTGIYANIAYIAKLNSNLKLSFGLRAGYSMYRFNYSLVNYRDQNETIYTDLATTNKGTLDMDAGLYLKGKTFFTGLSVTHLNGGSVYDKSFQAANLTTGTLTDYSLSYDLKPHLFLVFSKSFVVNDNFLINPSIMVKSVAQDRSSDLNLNFFFMKRVWAGVFVRKGFGFGALFQVYATDKLRVGYSYDAGTRDRRRLGASHEIMLGYDFGSNKSKMVSPRFL